jgi:hypothetical protein
MFGRKTFGDPIVGSAVKAAFGDIVQFGRDFALMQDLEVGGLLTCHRASGASIERSPSANAGVWNGARNGRI